MKDRKIRKDVSIRERLDDLIDNDADLKLHKLAYIFSGTKDYANDFQQLTSSLCWIPASLWTKHWRC
jgi:hypothetical protein